jgi:ADP-ribose pyrophosphatase YjhB (NUDIX family)
MLIFAVRLILEDQGHLLFLRQTKKNGGKYSLIGGTVEENEFAREALSREAKEEAGIQVNPEDMQLAHVLHRHKLKKDETQLMLYFRATRFRGEPASLERKKFEEVRWLPANELPEEVSKHTRHVLQRLQRGDIYSEFPSRSKIIAFWQQLGNRWTGFSDY